MLNEIELGEGICIYNIQSIYNYVPDFRFYDYFRQTKTIKRQKELTHKFSLRFDFISRQYSELSVFRVVGL